MKTLISITLTTAIYSSAIFAECVPPRTEVAWPDDYVDFGAYHRVHPSGDYLLVSNVEGLGRSTVVILDLKDRNPDGTPKVIATPFANEAYPDSNWDLISSPYGSSTPPMDFYSFKDILKNKAALVAAGQENKARPVIAPVYRDESFGQYYQSIAELPGSTPKDKKICTLLYSRSSEKCYDFKLDDDGKLAKVNGQEKNPAETQAAPLCGQSQSWSGPVLSKDGSYVSTRGDGTTTIYPVTRKADKTATCGQAIVLPGVGSKVSFSYPNSAPKAVTYYTVGPYKDMSERRGVKIHNLETNVSFWLSSKTEITESYPNFTADGRIVYTDTKAKKIITIDPNQIDEEGNVKADRSSCIQVNGTKASPAPVTTPKAKSV
ncbi:MAG TPA: hypothetical protein VNJ01_02195 [Bacteriovoracaceae bacterium]|nr:hypothetical protein [Bacteriovoracaceae bacterium]